MKKNFFITCIFVMLMAISGCGPFQPKGSSEENKHTVVDTAAIRAEIMEFEIQPINYVEAFQVFEESKMDDKLGLRYRGCLARTYKYNKNHKYKYDEYEEVNPAALYITYDDKAMLYDGLKVYGDDFIMINTYTYETRGGRVLGIDIPSQSKTVPVYVRRSDLLKAIAKIK